MGVSPFKISKREILSYFNSPVAYVFAVVFLLVASGLFMTPFFVAGLCDMRAFFSNLPLLLVIFVPALTMRLWAEERRTGTLSLLFSLPISSSNLVIGKFISALFFCSLALFSTITIPVMLASLGKPDFGPIIGGYAGAILLISFLLSLGMCISAFFKDQIVAFILSLVAGFFCFLSGTEFFSTFFDSWVPGLGTFLRHSIGISSHFSSFAKGVIDIGDVLFFISYSAIFLIINALTLEGRLKFKIQKGFFAGVALLIGIGLFFNAVIFDLRLPRFDLTENKIYTVSPGTKRVLEKLKVPISVIYYCSSKDKMPSVMKEMARDVSDILDELSKLSPKFTYKIVDPDTLTEKQRQELKQRGITPFSAQTIEKDSLNIKLIYSTIALSYLDKKEEIIPQVVPDSLGNLEYELVSKIFRLTLDKKPKVVLVAKKKEIPPQMAILYQRLGQPVPPGIDQFQTVQQILESQGYIVQRQEIKKDSPLPDDASALMLLGPHDFNKRQLYEIRKFLASGRPVFVASQFYKFRYTNGEEGIEARPHRLINNVDELFKDIGATINEDMLFDKRSLVLSIESQRQMGLFTAITRTPVNFPMQIKVLPDTMNQKISITGNLSGLLYLWGSALDVNDKELEKNHIRKIWLFSSSDQSWLSPYSVMPITTKNIPAPTESFKSYPLALILEGNFTNPFGENGVPRWPDEEANKDSNNDKAKNEKEPKKEASDHQLQGTPKKAKLLIVGCSEMFSDETISALSNAPFLLNAIDVLCLGDELINVRTKTQVQRFISDVSTGERLFWKAFTVLFAPILWSLFGVIRAIKRKKARANCTF